MWRDYEQSRVKVQHRYRERQIKVSLSGLDNPSFPAPPGQHVVLQQTS